MTYTQNKDGTFTVRSKSKPGNEWIVSEGITSCNCPKFKFILKGQSPCHHMDEVKLGETLILAAKAKDIGNNFPDFDRTKYLEPMMLHDFIYVFGESQYRVLCATANVYLRRGIVRLI